MTAPHAGDCAACNGWNFCTCGVPFLHCAHEWSQRGTEGDRWRECWLCGAQEDVSPDRCRLLCDGGDPYCPLCGSDQ